MSLTVPKQGTVHPHRCGKLRCIGFEKESTACPELGAWQATWQEPGLSIQIGSVWYEAQKTCAAEVFVRPTDIEPL